ncbi:MAG: C40 family peptidase [Armatimonadetes bacterium]|nr:C40 family peptidase [Armatimonadota bacterium]
MRQRTWWLATIGLVAAVTLAPVGQAAAATTHTVQPGETLYRLARMYGVPLEVLAAYNGIADPTRIRTGQVLRIPGRDGAPARGAPAPRDPGVAQAPAIVQAGPDAQITQVPVPVRAPAGLQGPGVTPVAAPGDRVSGPEPAPATHLVHAGETLYRISRRYGVSVEALMMANQLSTEIIKVGQALVIPDGAVPSPETPLPAVVAPARPAPPVIVPPQLPALRGQADAVLREATRLLGTPYRWGGTTARGLDCSGFILAAYASYVPNLPRTSFEQFRIGTPVEPSDLRAGDLVFFTTYAPGASHVGIYIGDGRFIHSSSAAGGVVITSLSDGYYAARYLGARRVLGP